MHALSFTSTLTSSTTLAALALLTLLSLSPTATAELDRRTLLSSPHHHHHHDRRAAYSVGPAWTGSTTVKQTGKTGVSAMQLTVVSNNAVVILDASEHNPLQVKGHSAWGQWYNVATNKGKALDIKTNSFCAGGSHLSNGTLVSLGGNPSTGSDLTDKNGLQAVRIFKTCDDAGCTAYESPARVRLAVRRWYPSSARLPDGSVIVVGGMIQAGFNNADGLDTSSIEYYPSKALNNGLPIASQFLRDALPSNLFPIVYTLTDNTVFMAANKLAMIYDWQNDRERRLPDLPTRINYPWTAASAMMPLSSANDYTPEIITCGGSDEPDDVDPSQLDSQSPTVAQCYRMVLNAAGIAAGWNTDDVMPYPRVMAEAVQMPDGKLLLVNGAQTGVAGYGDVPNQIGSSNADKPALQPVLYDPAAPRGSRFTTTGIAKSTVPRMYHSVATLLPDGRVMLAGSNPNVDVTTTRYQTEYRIEYIMPPYLSQPRPSFSALPAKIAFGANFKLTVTLPSGTTASQISVSLMDLGYATHGIHLDQRLVVLDVVSLAGKTLTVAGPPSANIYPPGPGFVYVLVDGVPSVGQRTIVGSGAAPPFSKSANANMLKKTANVSPSAARKILPVNNQQQNGSFTEHGFVPDAPAARLSKKRRAVAADDSQL